MVLEIADFTVLPGQEDDFTAAFRRAVGLIRSSPGFRSARMTRGVESSRRFVMLVEWNELDDHLVGFRESDRFTQWRAALGPFFDGAPRVEHFTDVAAEEGA
jgi:heme-degrading monooxygenase HmoA